MNDILRSVLPPINVIVVSVFIFCVVMFLMFKVCKGLNLACLLFTLSPLHWLTQPLLVPR